MLYSSMVLTTEDNNFLSPGIFEVKTALAKLELMPRHKKLSFARILGALFSEQNALHDKGLIGTVDREFPRASGLN